MSKLSQQQISEIEKRYQKGDISQRELAALYNVSQTTITRILNPSYAAKDRESNRLRINQNRERYTRHLKKYSCLTFHIENDADIINKLDSVTNRQGYIKALIRRDIESESGRGLGDITEDNGVVL